MGTALWLLIDGYNVVQPAAAPRRHPHRWLQRERKRLLDRLVAHLPEQVRCRTCVVFDSKDPPVGVADRYVDRCISVRFAVDYPEADDLLEKLIARHSSAKQLTVVSSDNRVQTAASRRGATAWHSDRWIDRLVDGRIELAIDPSKYEISEVPSQIGDDDANLAGEQSVQTDSPDEETQRWMREFGF